MFSLGWTFWHWDVNFTSKFRYHDKWPNCFLHRNVLVAIRDGISCEWWIQKMWAEWHMACFKVVICRNWGIPLMISVKEGCLSVWIRTRNLRIRSRVAAFVDILKCNRWAGARNRYCVSPWYFRAQRRLILCGWKRCVCPRKSEFIRAKGKCSTCLLSQRAMLHTVILNENKYFIILVRDLALNSAINMYFTT